MRCEACRLTPVVDGITIADDLATVELRLDGSFRFAHDPEPLVFEDEHHTVELQRSTDGFWRLVEDTYRDEFSDCYPRGTDFRALASSLPARLSEWKADQERLGTPEATVVNPGDSGLLATYLTYNRTSAQWYATRYTDNIDYNTTNYNLKFQHWSADCCNFASQCIWYGFGGIDNSAYIDGHLRPMVVFTRDGGEDWWCDSVTACSPDGHWPWTYIPDFRTLIKGNYQYNGVGVQGWDIGLSGLAVGDCAEGTNSDGSLHIMIVTSATDLDGDGVLEYSEVKVSAHTKNRNNQLLSGLYVDPTRVAFYRIIRYRYS